MIGLLRTCFPIIRGIVLGIATVLVCASYGWAQSAELSLREFASGQVKKGVRSIGFGGDGATWGNYGLVWKDAGTALVDFGDTNYTNGNNFHFEAVGVTSPLFWHDLAVYVIALNQSTNDIRLTAKSPGLGPDPLPVAGRGSNQAVFTKAAMPLGYGFSAGALLSHEESTFTAQSDAGKSVRYETEWRPSGGYGVAWQQPGSSLLIGFRALHNRDLERRTDAAGETKGLAKSNEYRIGTSISPWHGALVDAGGTRLYRQNGLTGAETTYYAPNLGFEQSFNDNTMAFRFGLDESSPGAGFSAKFADFKLDIAYIHNLGRERLNNLFGNNSNSIIVTLNWHYQNAFTAVEK